MSWQYDVSVGVDAPESPVLGNIWIKPDVCQAFVLLGVEWVVFAGSGPLVGYTMGKTSKTVIVQESEPVSSPGQIWIKESINTAYIYLDDWYVILGA
jgi:hypothetical protein